MRLPFLSRSLHEAAIAAAERRYAELLRLHADERRRSEHLMDTVVAMKMSGGAVSRLSPLAPGEKHAQPPRSAIDQAIDETPHASTYPPRRAHLHRWAAKELERGRDEAAICAEIRKMSIVSDTDDDDDDDDDDDIVRLT